MIKHVQKKCEYEWIWSKEFLTTVRVAQQHICYRCNCDSVCTSTYRHRYQISSPAGQLGGEISSTGKRIPTAHYAHTCSSHSSRNFPLVTNEVKYNSNSFFFSLRNFRSNLPHYFPTHLPHRHHSYHSHLHRPDYHSPLFRQFLRLLRPLCSGPLPLILFFSQMTLSFSLPVCSNTPSSIFSSPPLPSFLYFTHTHISPRTETQFSQLDSFALTEQNTFRLVHECGKFFFFLFFLFFSFIYSIQSVLISLFSWRADQLNSRADPPTTT